jgi:uncharacterized protein YijF (DUF1287 family)
MLLVRRTVEQRNAICTEYKAKYEKVWIIHFYSFVMLHSRILDLVTFFRRHAVSKTLEKMLKIHRRS